MDFRNVKVPKVPGGGATSALLKLGVIGGIALYAATNSLYNVEGGHRAIVFNRLVGVKDKVYPEGTHIMIPWFERPVIYDVRARPHLVESTSGSRDLQMVKIGLRVLTRPLPDQLPTIYRTLGENFNERVLPSIIHETLKAVVAQYNASQLITQREGFSYYVCPTVLRVKNNLGVEILALAPCLQGLCIQMVLYINCIYVVIYKKDFPIMIVQCRCTLPRTT
ncbi:hypothetical protein EUGRSUZ_A01869 [Eucalyptus grandis]|uniref:Uncharacterized protein n=2 Tax=Eucalyptus grandis TaxID=71139 RepID=A0ACC3M4I6_EUCGR|nr:hypothetical protein EUGRSUZ_A01869 [Eucalyptus grandis]